MTGAVFEEVVVSVKNRGDFIEKVINFLRLSERDRNF